MDHATCNSLLLLEVVLLNLALGDLCHELEIHEAALSVGVGLCSHQSHCLLVVVEVRVLSMHRTLLNGGFVRLQASETLDVLVLLPVLVGLAVLRVARHVVI